MLESKFVLWFGMMFPLIFSAGPANVAMAALSAKQGFFRLVPFLSGINLTVFVQAVLIGSGAGVLLGAYPRFFYFLQYLGSIYLIYLAYKIISQPLSGEVNESSDTSLGFLDGIILESLNVKLISVTIVMFSKFLDSTSTQLFQVLLLSLGIAVLTTGATVSWALGGSWLQRKFASEQSERIQRYVFGGMLICVSLWMIVRN
ncbi:LysE family translocator [Spongorhabdus nitratireducens]